MELSILIVGVGGQGTLLASRVLGKYAEYVGLDCKLSEVHGMAQRGGSVVTHVKIAKQVYAPLVQEGESDVLVAFEELEALRYAHYLKSNGSAIVNCQQIMPMPVVTGAAVYPINVIEKMQAFCKNVIPVDALRLACKAGSARAVNTVMLGKLCKHMQLDRNTFLKAVEACVPVHCLSLNQMAFELGYGEK